MCHSKSPGHWRVLLPCLLVLFGVLSGDAVEARTQDPVPRTTLRPAGLESAGAGVVPLGFDGAPTGLAPELLEASEAFDAGLERWRAGDVRGAEALWLKALEVVGPPPALSHGREILLDRWAICHNLGNAAFRDGRALDAVGWYRAALRHGPRALDTLENLSLAERAAELDARSEVDFVGSSMRLMKFVSAEEAPWLALLGLLPVGVILLAEALRGGRGWRLLSIVSVLFALACLGPFVRYRMEAPGGTVMVAESGGVERRREPLEKRQVVGRWPAGEVLRVLDELPGWHRLEDSEGERGWVPTGGVFGLER